MQIKQVQIHSTMGKIGMETVRPKMEITNTRSQVSIDTEPAKLEVQSDKPKVVIDSSECWYERGFKMPERFTADNAAYGSRKLSENIGMIANQGRRMADLGRSPETRALIAQISKEKSARPIELQIVTIPQSRPKIQVTGYLNMNWTPHNTQFDISRYDVSTHYQKGQLNIYMRTWPQVQINFIDVLI